MKEAWYISWLAFSGRIICFYLYLSTCCESTEDIYHQGTPQWPKFSIDRALDLCTSRSTDASWKFHSHPGLSDSILAFRFNSSFTKLFSGTAFFPFLKLMSKYSALLPTTEMILWGRLDLQARLFRLSASDEKLIHLTNLSMGLS